MIGMYGIIANETLLDNATRQKAFSLMSNDVIESDFFNTTLSGKNFSVGLTLRTIGENKDMALKRVSDNFFIIFCGYGKFRGERKLFWASEMIERIVAEFSEKDAKILSSLEGCFTCLIYFGGSLFLMSDRFGSKNLYYYDSQEMFILAPDVGRILESGLVPRKKNYNAIKQILFAGFFLDDSTLAENVFRFPQATVMIRDFFHKKKAIFTKYWQTLKQDGRVDEVTHEVIENFSETIHQAILEPSFLEERFVVPLSGGMDSRTIASYLSNYYALNTITYNLGNEVSIAQKVSKVINAKSYYFSNESLLSEDFSSHLKLLINSQKVHTVVNQYFYAPFFRQYFMGREEERGIFDGIYLDMLFSIGYFWHEIGPYPYNFDSFFRKHTNDLTLIINYFDISKEEIVETVKKYYYNTLDSFGPCDGVAKSNLFYYNGRLRSYANENACAKENYCYVFRPGFNYDLVDFAFQLNVQLRRGKLYKMLLHKKFPQVMKVRFIDTYKTRKESVAERLARFYNNTRFDLSCITHGRIPFSRCQMEYFFLQRRKIDEYIDLFFDVSSISELISQGKKVEIFNNTRRKYYFFDIFQIAFFLQQFFYKYGY